MAFRPPRRRCCGGGAGGGSFLEPQHSHCVSPEGYLGLALVGRTSWKASGNTAGQGPGWGLVPGIPCWTWVSHRFVWSGVAVLRPALPSPGKPGGWVLPSSKGSLSAQPLPFLSLPWGADGSAEPQHRGRAGRPSRRNFQKELAALAPGPGTPELGILRAPGSHLSPSAQGASVCLRSTLSPHRSP